MNTVKIKKQGVRMIAHAGLAGLEPINSIAGYVAAANRSYYGIETDVRRTADGRFVAFHDKTLEARAGINESVEGITFAEISSLVLTDRSGRRDRRDLIIPTLRDYIEICKQYEKHAVLELSGAYQPEWIDEITREIEFLGYLDNTTFISFCYDNLKMVRRLLPNQPVQFIFSDTSEQNINRLIADGIDADLRFTSVTREIVEKLHNSGLKVNCYTVDRPENAEELVEYGVDFITTNILE